MRTVYAALRENDSYEDMSEFDKLLVDEYEAEKREERADRMEVEEE